MSPESRMLKKLTEEDLAKLDEALLLHSKTEKAERGPS